MKTKNELQTTINSSLFNKLYKEDLEANGKIRCARCKYNRGENENGKFYGKYQDRRPGRYPNWKLYSKNKKQWMEKPKAYKVVTVSIFGRTWTTIKF